MTITVNGDPRPLTPGATVLDLLTSLDLHPRTVAVELNGDILPRASWSDHRLHSGDRLEIVHCVQGG